MSEEQIREHLMFQDRPTEHIEKYGAELRGKWLICTQCKKVWFAKNYPIWERNDTGYTKEDAEEDMCAECDKKQKDVQESFAQDFPLDYDFGID